MDKQTPMYKGLLELNKYFEKSGHPNVTLDVIGGFALIIHGIKDAYVTDIDYVGNDIFSYEDMKVIDQIGVKHGLGRGWINNDVMLSGSTVEDLEISVGKLHFEEAFSLSHINVRVLDKKDLLRLKVIAVDTSLAALEFGGEFTRVKDLPDIKALMDDADMDILSLEMELWKDCDISDKTWEVIDEYLRGGCER